MNHHRRTGAAMNLRHHPLDDALVVAVESPRLESSNADEFKELAGALITAGNRRLIFDLTQVEFMDSRGLGSLIAILKLVSPDGALALTGLNRHVLDLFKLTRLDRIFPIHRDPESAAKAVAKPAG